MDNRISKNINKNISAKDNDNNDKAYIGMTSLN